MTQSGPQSVVGTRQNIRMEEEWPLRLPAPTAISGNTITFAAAGLSNMGIGTDMLKGQTLFVLEKTGGGSPVAGMRLKIAGNTTNVITLEQHIEGTYKKSDIPTSVFGDWARCGFTTYGIIPGELSQATVDANYGDPSCVLMWGVIDEADLPEAVKDLTEQYAHGSRNMPGRHQVVYNRDDHPLSYSTSVIDGRHWQSFFNDSYEVPSKFDTENQSLSLDIYPGDNQVTVAAAGTFAAGDYIMVGDDSGYSIGTDWASGSTVQDQEIRKITDVTGTVLTVDRPFRRFHDASSVDQNVREVHADCYGVTGTAYDSDDQFIYHHMEVGNSIRPTTFTHMVVKKGEHDNVTVQDWLLAYRGCQWSSLSLKSTTSQELMADWSGGCVTADLDPVDKDGASITAPTLDDEAFYDITGAPQAPVHWSQSIVSVNVNGAGYVEIPTVEDISFTITKVFDARYSHSYNTYGLPSGRKPQHYIGRVNYDLSFVVPLHNKVWSQALRDMDYVDFKTVYTVPIGTETGTGNTVSSTWTIIAEDQRIKEAGLKLPSEAVEAQTILGPPKVVKIIIKDKTPYYPLAFR